MNEISKVINYWDNRPCNIRHSNKEVGSREYFDEVEKRKYFVEPHIPDFAQFSNWEGKRVLEVGCGIGTDAVNFCRAGAIYTGVDISKNSCELTQARLEVYNLSGRIINYDAEKLSQLFRGEQFDLIYSFGVIHHSPKPSDIIKELAALSHDQTCFKLMLYAENSWKNFMIDGGFDQPEAQSGCPFAFTYTKESVEALLAPHFKIDQITQDHIFPYIVTKYVNYEYEKQPYFANMPDDLFRLLEKKLGWHLLVTSYPT